MSDTVEILDVDEASRLLREAIKDYATDPKTGRIDMDLILSGTAAHERNIQNSLKEALLSKLSSYANNRVEFARLFKDFNDQSQVVSLIVMW
jgi:DNA replication licensing factor MCM4